MLMFYVWPEQMFELKEIVVLKTMQNANAKLKYTFKNVPRIFQLLKIASKFVLWNNTTMYKNVFLISQNYSF